MHRHMKKKKSMHFSLKKEKCILVSQYNLFILSTSKAIVISKRINLNKFWSAEGHIYSCFFLTRNTVSIVK